MTIDEIRNTLIEALVENQSWSGYAVPRISDATRPIGDLEGFDSLNATEVSVMLSESLRREVPMKVMLAPVNGESPKVRDIVARLYELVEPKGGQGNEPD